jgi:hypothetical protein
MVRFSFGIRRTASGKSDKNAITQTVDGNNYYRLCKVTLADSRPGVVAFKVMLPGVVVT